MRPVAHQISVVTAAKGLFEDAREAAQAVPQGTADWHFYSGVQSAANEVLHSELHLLRADSENWPDAEPPAFREGYAKARTALVTAGSALVPPLRIALPKP